MKAKEYLLVAVILAACVIAVLLPTIASGSLRPEISDSRSTMPNGVVDLLPSILGLKWPPTASSLPAAALPYTPTASPSAVVSTAAYATATVSTFSLNFTPAVTPTPFPVIPSRVTRPRGEQPADDSLPAPTATNVPPTNPPATQPQPTNAPATNPPATSVPPTNAPPTNVPPTRPPATNPPSVPSIIPPIIRTIIPLPFP